MVDENIRQCRLLVIFLDFSQLLIPHKAVFITAQSSIVPGECESKSFRVTGAFVVNINMDATILALTA